MLPQWREIMSVDFAAQPSQLLAPDGPYVIGGQPWTVSGSATNVATTGGLRIVNGSGLYFPFPTGAAVGNTYLVNHTRCILRWQLPATTVQGMPMACFLWTDTVTPGGPNPACHMIGAFAHPSTATVNVYAVGRRKDNPGITPQAWNCWRNQNGVLRTDGDQTIWIANSDVLGVVLPHGVNTLLPGIVKTGLSGDGAFTDPMNATVPVTFFTFGNDQLYAGDTTLPVQDPANWGFEISLQAGGSTDNDGIILGAKVLAYY